MRTDVESRNPARATSPNTMIAGFRTAASSASSTTVPSVLCSVR
ncbi:hypothetical protein [Microbacterium sp. NIBRBAC000506063]|nr:hypothetical protein [Microbacterium sp. NIBRBAC000506063]